MAIPLFDEINKLIDEKGSAAVLRERVALVKERNEALERRVAELEKSNKVLLDTVTSQVSKREPAKADLALFRRHIEHFVPDGPVLVFLRQHDMANRIHESILQPLWHYTDSWRGPNYEFLDEELEEMRLNFRQLVEKFTAKHALQTFPILPEGFFSMEFRDNEDNPEKIIARDELNEMSTAAATAFDDFYRTGRRIFPDELFHSK